ncbi:MAG: pantoate--beta-alanine ligase [Myxococcales bacterium]|nr:pantoate--beta-alanine ligase [Myxococcales bacterium]MCB9531278.1 pantoate--beta-alanine ligase [Myxococcales bacterium]
MQILTTKSELRSALSGPAQTGLVPTMGFLHEGHMSLFRQARAENERVVATVFVNPTQFGPTEDLDRYPRDPDGDAAKCAESGVDILWMPPRDEVYGPRHATTVTVAGLTDGLCGRSRPTHFAGVATIVTKLFALVRPERAYFGEKDYQQLAVIRQMAADLDLGVDVIGMPIVREADGLAMSSRNKYLSAEDRAAALALSRALRAAAEAFDAGSRDADTLVAGLTAELHAAPGVALEYAEIVDAETLAPATGTLAGPARALVAARVGQTRLIDNIAIG